MWLWYDWRAAAVVDDNGNILDEAQWDGPYGEHQIIERLDLIAANRLTKEAQILNERFEDAVVARHGDSRLPQANYPLPDNAAQVACDQAVIAMSRRGVALAAGDPDKRLEHLLKASDEARSTYITMEARMVEWIILFLPDARFGKDRAQLAKLVANSDSLESLARVLEVDLPPVGPSKSEWKSIRDWAENVAGTSRQLARLENAIRELSEEHIPSTAKLVGPLLAARLMVEAHGRMRLARLPSGTVQVLGAEKAFFNHLKTGAPPPKHGHIFMHPWISKSPRWVRGKIARMLANKISLAAKSDAFQGEVWSDEKVASVEERVNEIRATFPNPPSRK